MDRWMKEIYVTLAPVFARRQDAIYNTLQMTGLMKRQSNIDPTDPIRVEPENFTDEHQRSMLC